MYGVGNGLVVVEIHGDDFFAVRFRYILSLQRYPSGFSGIFAVHEDKPFPRIDFSFDQIFNFAIVIQTFQVKTKRFKAVHFKPISYFSHFHNIFM